MWLGYSLLCAVKISGLLGCTIVLNTQEVLTVPANINTLIDSAILALKMKK